MALKREHDANPTQCDAAKSGVVGIDIGALELLGLLDVVRELQIVWPQLSTEGMAAGEARMAMVQDHGKDAEEELMAV